MRKPSNLPYDYNCAKCDGSFTEDEVITVEIKWGGFDNLCENCYAKAYSTAITENYSPYKDFQHLLE